MVTVLDEQHQQSHFRLHQLLANPLPELLLRIDLLWLLAQFSSLRGDASEPCH